MLGHVDLLEIAEAQDAGAVEQQAQLPAVLPAEVGQSLLHGAQVGHVQRAVPDIAKGSGLGGEGLGVAVQQAHLPATLVEQPGGGSADAGGCAGDEEGGHLSPPAGGRASGG